MFKLTDLKCMRWVLSAVYSISMVTLLAACVHPPSDPGEAKSRMVKDVASKTTAELYADLIAPGIFEQSASYDSDGYQVVSGNLRMKDNSQGYLIDVRSLDGSHFALLGGVGKDGVLKVTKNGERTFTPFPSGFDQLIRDDIVVGHVEQGITGSSKPDKTMLPRAPVVIDVLAAYTRSAVNSGYVGADLNADARARLETVNLSLRNAKINSVELRLVKVVTYEPSPKITSETLANMNAWFGAAATQSGADLIALFVGSDSHVSIGGGTILGKAYMPGRFSISTVTNNRIFAHEIGHNVGGGHCLGDNPNYKNGYEQGVLCKDNEFWYSGLIGWEPGQHAKGNWMHADMARTWLEEKYRLASYAPPYPPRPEFYEMAPENFRAIPGAGSIQFFWDPVPGAVNYRVIKRLGIPPIVGTPIDTNYLLEGRQANRGTYSVEGADANGKLSLRSVYIEASPLP